MRALSGAGVTSDDHDRVRQHGGDDLRAVRADRQLLPSQRHGSSVFVLLLPSEPQEQRDNVFRTRRRHRRGITTKDQLLLLLLLEVVPGESVDELAQAIMFRRRFNHVLTHGSASFGVQVCTAMQYESSDELQNALGVLVVGRRRWLARQLHVAGACRRRRHAPHNSQHTRGVRLQIRPLVATEEAATAHTPLARCIHGLFVKTNAGVQFIPFTRRENYCNIAISQSIEPNYDVTPETTTHN